MTRPDEIPPLIWESLQLYLQHHLQPGGFLRAVLEGDLFQSVARGDEEAVKAIPALARYLYSNCPIGCYGSPHKVRTWLTQIEPIESEEVG